jgi:CHAD domain-containing protein
MTTPLLTASRLRQPAHAGICWVGLSLVERVIAESARVERRTEAVTGPNGARSVDADPEAVHQFRAALRRLRSWLRLWRSCVQDGIAPDAMRRLARLSRLAGEARDLEVQRAWLQTARVRRCRPARACAQVMRRETTVAYARALRRLAGALHEEGAPTIGGLRNALRDAVTRRAAGRWHRALAAEFAKRLRVAGHHLPGTLRRVRRVGQVRRAHRARIVVKHTRYFLDTLCLVSSDARSAGAHLAKVQDRLGALHDAHVMTQRLADRRERTRDERRLDGLSALLGLSRQRSVDAFTAVRRTIRRKALARTVAAIRQARRGLAVMIP